MRRLRRALGLTLRDVEQITGMHFSHIGKLERGEADTTTESLAKIAKALGVKAADLLNDEITPIAVRPIPLLSRIPAGDPKQYTDGDYPAGWAEEFVPCPEDIKDRSAFGLRVEGKSMEPLFAEGDILIISPYAKLKEGSPVAFRLRDETCAVKIYRRGEKGEIILAPQNPKGGALQVLKVKDFCWIYPVVKAIKTIY